MKIYELRKQGSQALDSMAEFILTDKKLEVYEASGNGEYYLAREYIVKHVEPYKEPVVDIEINDLERLVELSPEKHEI